MATEKPRYTVSVDKEMFQQIEDFRFAHRYQTRSEATVELIRLGLESLEREKNTGGPILDKNDDAAQKSGLLTLPGRGGRQSGGDPHRIVLRGRTAFSTKKKPVCLWLAHRLLWINGELSSSFCRRTPLPCG